MSCWVEHESTYANKNYIYCRAREYPTGKQLPTLLQVPFIPKNDDGDDDEYEDTNVEPDVQSNNNDEVGEPSFITRGGKYRQLDNRHESNAQGIILIRG